MKNNCIQFIIIVLCTISQAQQIQIPDLNFKKALLEAGVDTDQDNQIDSLEAKAATHLDLINKNISDLTGLGAFTNLQELYLMSNSISTINLEGFTWLRKLHVGFNLLSKIDLTYLYSLEEFWGFDNALEEIKFGNKYNLHNIDISNNLLTSLALEKLPNLKTLTCDRNFLEGIDLKANKQLQFLNCSSNEMKTLDLSNLPSLTGVYCNTMGLQNLYLQGDTSLVNMFCSMNALTNVNFKGLKKMKYLNCAYNDFNSLDLSDLTILESLNCSGNDLQHSLNLKANLKLKALYCTANPDLDFICLSDPSTPNVYNTTFSKDYEAQWTSNCPTVTSLDKEEVTIYTQLPVKAYNLLGMEVSVYTTGSLVILEYADGTRKKTIQ